MEVLVASHKGMYEVTQMVRATCVPPERRLGEVPDMVVAKENIKELLETSDTGMWVVASK